MELRNRADGVAHRYDALGRSGDVVEVLAPNDTAYFAVRPVRELSGDHSPSENPASTSAREYDLNAMCVVVRSTPGVLSIRLVTTSAICS